MTIKKNIRVVILPLILLGLGSCSSSDSYQSAAQEDQHQSIESDTYTSAFPSQDVSSALEEIQRSVKRITATGIYQTFYFDKPLYTKNQLKTGDLTKISDRSFTQDESTAGTAVSLAELGDKTLLLTCAHVITMPDTIITYHSGENLPDKTFVKTLTVKSSQTNLILDSKGVEVLNIIAKDDDKDLALAYFTKDETNNINAPPLPIDKGKPKQLKWGSFVYVIGYPKGYPMITRGIVSDPNQNQNGNFVIDALFNKGISGGLIIAARGSAPNFEWVGVASTASASQETFISPNPARIQDYGRYDIYRDNLYIDRKSRIDYGITKPIPVNLVSRFILENAPSIRNLGFTVSSLAN